MNSSILTIPVEDVFSPKEGCPLCRLHKMLEDRFIEYITGAAMMEPDIRIETNKKGFCGEHFELMLKQKNRLSVALILETHLAELDKTVLSASTLLDKTAKVKKAKEAISTCFVCENISYAENNLSKAIYNMYSSDKNFKALFNEQEYLCMPHFVKLCEGAQKGLNKKDYSTFIKDAENLCHNYIKILENDVHHFTTMFDYRNSGPDADWGNSKDSIERTINFLTSNRL